LAVSLVLTSSIPQGGYRLVKTRPETARITSPAPVEWLVSPEPVEYGAALAAMEARVTAIRAGYAPECVWLLQHPPLYTAGTSAAETELVDRTRFPVHRTGRGGRFTYHGPGQRVAYVMLDLAARGRDVRGLVRGLQAWVVGALSGLGVQAHGDAGRVGIWVDTPQGEAKLGAIGVRVRRWVSFHGVSINVDPDLSHYAGIVPCGLDAPVTSLAALGVAADMDQLDGALRAAFDEAFERGALTRSAAR
jgi:lipoyl(octanoyl) transferase